MYLKTSCLRHPWLDSNTFGCSFPSFVPESLDSAFVFPQVTCPYFYSLCTSFLSLGLDSSLFVQSGPSHQVGISWTLSSWSLNTNQLFWAPLLPKSLFHGTFKHFLSRLDPFWIPGFWAVSTFPVLSGSWTSPSYGHSIKAVFTFPSPLSPSLLGEYEVQQSILSHGLLPGN